MYKRPARIQFLSPLHPELCTAALELCAQRGAGWIEAAGGEAPARWPDLIVWLDSPVEAMRAAQSPQALVRQWSLAEPWQDNLAQRIEGLLGGLRLLARLDDSGVPGDARIGQDGENGPVDLPFLPHSGQNGRVASPDIVSTRRRKNC